MEEEKKETVPVKRKRKTKKEEVVVKKKEENLHQKETQLFHESSVGLEEKNGPLSRGQLVALRLMEKAKLRTQ